MEILLKNHEVPKSEALLAPPIGVIPRRRRLRRRQTVEPSKPVTSEIIEETKADTPPLEALSVGKSPDLQQDDLETLSRAMSLWFVRHKNQFFMVDQLNAQLTQADVKRISVRRFEDQFPDIELTNELLQSVFQRAIAHTHNCAEMSIPIWNGSTRCTPGNDGALIWERETVAINVWQPPDYRHLNVEEADTAMLDELLARMFTEEVDRVVAKDWLAWCLQNEADKPAWALFLYSRKKGTGKSTFCQLATRLFGEKNSITQNSIQKLTGRFNKPILDSKLVISEELQLKPDSSHGNTLKTFITEKVTASEAKGREVEKVEQCCCFLFTTNHIPLWIEADERRYYVIDADHDGHASGPRAEEFGAFVGQLNQWMQNDQNIASLYNGLMQHKVSNEFNPRSLNLSLVRTPVMQQIMAGSREVLLVRLEEHLASTDRFAIPQEELAKVFIEDLKTSQNRIRHMMPELGWRAESAKWGGVDHSRTVWVHRDYQVGGGRVRGPGGYDEPVCPVEEEVEII